MTIQDLIKQRREEFEKEYIKPENSLKWHLGAEKVLAFQEETVRMVVEEIKKWVEENKEPVVQWDGVGYNGIQATALQAFLKTNKL